MFKNQYQLYIELHYKHEVVNVMIYLLARWGYLVWVPETHVIDRVTIEK